MKKKVKAWAVSCDGRLCQHEETFSVYPTLEEAKAGMIEPSDGLPKCTNDLVIPIEITYQP